MGETGLHKCSRNSHQPVVGELLGYVMGHIGKTNGFVKTVNNEGESSLHLAAKIKKSNLHFPDEDLMIIKLLMEHGSNAFVQTKVVRVAITI